MRPFKRFKMWTLNFQPISRAAQSQGPGVATKAQNFAFSFGENISFETESFIISRLRFVPTDREVRREFERQFGNISE